MDYYDKKQMKSMITFKQSLIVLAYVIIFYTLWNIYMPLFWVSLVIFISNKIFNLRIMCRLFGCIPDVKSKHNIVKCKRCNYPMYRIK